MSPARHLFCTALLFTALTATAYAFNSPLTAGQISKALFGQEFIGEYPNGRAWTERFNRDGTSDYVEGGVHSNGVMRLTGRKICFTYNKQALNGGCFEVWQRSSNCFDFYAVDDTGFPGAGSDQLRSGTGWSARGWRADEASTCTSDQIS